MGFEALGAGMRLAVALCQSAGQWRPLHIKSCHDLAAGLREPDARTAADKPKNDAARNIKKTRPEIISFSRKEAE
jgi:hypothetical protein